MGKRTGLHTFGIVDEQEELASYLKDREAEGVKSVQFYFPNDLDASTQTINHIVVDVAGFSSGVVAFTSRCEQARQLVCPSCSYA